MQSQHNIFMKQPEKRSPYAIESALFVQMCLTDLRFIDTVDDVA